MSLCVPSGELQTGKIALRGGVERLQAKELGSAHLVQALPLLQLGCDASEAADWAKLIYRQYLGGMDQKPHAGLVVAEDARGYVAGVFAYRVVTDMPAYLIFDCQKFVVPDQVGSRWAFKLLIDEAEGRARYLRCTHLRVSLPLARDASSRQAGMEHRHLVEGGFRCEAAQFVKPLARSDLDSQAARATRMGKA